MLLASSGKSRSARQARYVTLHSAAAVLSASLLGIGLAYCACALLIPAVAHERSDASVPAVDGRPQDVICSSGTSSTSPQRDRAEE
jgi:hypothetical protein